MGYDLYNTSNQAISGNTTVNNYDFVALTSKAKYKTYSTPLSDTLCNVAVSLTGVIGHKGNHKLGYAVQSGLYS